MRVDLNDIALYCQFGDEATTYFLNLRNYDIMHVDDIVLKINVPKDYFLLHCRDYGYLQLPFVSEVKLLRHYIDSWGNEEYSKYFSAISDEDLWVEFDTIFPVGPEYDTWIDLFRNTRYETAEAWCKENGIRFVRKRFHLRDLIDRPRPVK